ncbi:MAG: GNAT family N-acetyltransferase [Candidatus Odinarchaeota archaeon]
MEVNIKPLTPENIEDFLYFFDNIGFTDNPDWAGCYCHFYHFSGNVKEWGKRSHEQNRNASMELILAKKMNGLLAYLDNKPIGWCNVNSKENFAKIPYEESSNVKIASIVCFVVAPSHRRQGIAKKLLKFACSLSQNNGYDLIEAYPRKVEKLSDAYSYHGPLSLYTSEGFSIYKELKDYYVVHKKLQ